jgi:hypothetical protein
MQHDRHEWMLTDEEMVDVRQHMSPYASPYHTERAMCLAQARKIAEWLERKMDIKIDGYEDVYAQRQGVRRFIREAKGESDG